MICFLLLSKRIQSFILHEVLSSNSCVAQEDHLTMTIPCQMAYWCSSQLSFLFSPILKFYINPLFKFSYNPRKVYLQAEKKLIL